MNTEQLPTYDYRTEPAERVAVIGLGTQQFAEFIVPPLIVENETEQTLGPQMSNPLPDGL